MGIIITHMRQFGRKTDPNLEKVQINDVFRQAFEIFSQQLNLRGIEVVWQIDDPLPLIMGDKADAIDLEPANQRSSGRSYGVQIIGRFGCFEALPHGAAI